MTVARIKNWRHFQHYKDRDPPWIKLHFSMLSSSDWVCLDDCSRVLAIACMLVGSRNQGEIDVSERGLAYLQRVAYLHKRPNIKPLIECGFLEDASNCKRMLANDTTETETETETETPTAPRDESRAAATSPTNGHAKSLIGIPLHDGSEFPITEDQVREFDRLYPAVDVMQTLREIRGWNIANPTKRKTRAGALRHVNGWLAKEQNKGG